MKRLQPIHRAPRGAFLTILALLGLFSASAVRAQQVQAALSQEYSAVGQPVQLNVSVVGGRGVQLPPDLKVDGLETRIAGKSEQMQVQMSNGRLATTVTSVYTYLIVPLKQGNFTIPAIPVTVDGKSYKTTALTLRVGGNSGGVPVLPAVPAQRNQQQQQTTPPPPAVQTAPPQSQASRQPNAGDKLAFGELLIPKKTAFAGEMIPAELRFYFDTSISLQNLSNKPGFTGDGFTVAKFSDPTEGRQEIEGRVFYYISFQTAITPIKTGTLEIPEATLEGVVRVPIQNRAGADDIFGSLLGQMTEARQVKVLTESSTLEVKPLPKADRPENFGGAIGQFSLQATASPKKAESGDPVSLNVTVAGRGNFDGMSAPILINAEGWRTYPPSEKFEPSQSDPIGYNGEKRFEYMLLARQDQTQTPVAEFSFFDPSLEKYVTLKSAPIPVVAKGGGADAQTTTAVAAAATPTPNQAPTPAGTSLASGFQSSSFTPLVQSQGFLVANGALAAVWCAALIFACGRLAKNSASAKKSAALREVRKQLRRLEDLSCDGEEFWQTASNFVHARLVPAGSYRDTREALAESSVSDSTKAAIAELLDRCDAQKYSTSGTSEKPGADERRQLLEQLKTFDAELH